MSDIASEIVDQIFSGDKVNVVDTIDTAFSDRAYELIQQKKIEFAKQWGFELDKTAQAAADEVSDQLPDGSEEPQDYEVDDRMPHEAPEDEELTTEEEPEDETDIGTN